MPVIAAILAIGAIVVTVALQRAEDGDHDAEGNLETIKLELTRLQTLPFQGFSSAGGSPVVAGFQIDQARRTIDENLDSLHDRSPPASLATLEAALGDNEVTLDRIYALGIASSMDGAATPSSGSGLTLSPRLTELATEAATSYGRATRLSDETAEVYEDRSAAAAQRATLGAAAVIMLLLAAFAYFYLRSSRVALENRRMLESAREESLTDALTGLGNRRSLVQDLDLAVRETTGGGQELILSLFDLDGFKQYNDTFGHPAGDSLLRRLGVRLKDSVEGRATAYRMGGDEFCLLSRVPAGGSDEATALARAALTESGKGFRIDCSYGTARIPGEAKDAEGALSLADGRMYEQKAELDSAGRQSSDVLLRVLSERDPALGEHLSSVAELAERTCLDLGLSEQEAKRIHMAAELHDVGKTGIPDAIMEKPGPLDEDDTAFMQRHSLIGERILRAASSLAPVAGLVRSHHERMDGEGYPDGLEGEHIPIGARVIFAADAFDAMTSERPYREAISVPEALAELRACAGTQFDPRVVEAIARLVQEPEPRAPAPAAA